MTLEGTALRVLRQAAGLRQSELAAAAGVTRQHVHNVEAGAKVLSPRLVDVLASIVAPMIRSTEEDVRRLLSPREEK